MAQTGSASPDVVETYRQACEVLKSFDDSETPWDKAEAIEQVNRLASMLRDLLWDLIPFWLGGTDKIVGSGVLKSVFDEVVGRPQDLDWLLEHSENHMAVKHLVNGWKLIITRATSKDDENRPPFYVAVHLGPKKEITIHVYHKVDDILLEWGRAHWHSYSERKA